MWEAARASSAAPLYFPEMNINGQTYWDGGMRSNNPIDQVFEEACREFGEDADFRLILSIGTGRPERKEVQRGILGVLKIATQFLTDTENKHEQFVQRFRDKYVGEGKPYVRLNGGGELAGVDLADYRSIEKIEELAREYVRVENRHIEACARRLAKVG
jgi:predicted acylesterase/phospholipase RssA